MKNFAWIALMAFLAGPTAAQAAEEWGLPEEKIARFEAKVVDVLCELSGDCPKNCGSGKRQLGLIDGDGKLILPLKNSVIFAGAAAELILEGERFFAFFDEGLFEGHFAFAGS